MALLKPFRALRYDVRTAGPLDELVAPPYDVVTPELRTQLSARSPYNAVRLVRPDGPEEAARTLADWRDRSLLVRDAEPAAWLGEETFSVPGGESRRRRSVVARVRLAPYAEGTVLPHERTFPGAKAARLELLRATRTKLSPIFLVHGGASPELPDGPPDLEATLDGVTTRLWRLPGGERAAPALAGVRGRLLIADGHHRYETALRFHEEDGGEETAYVLAALVSREDSGLVIFPTHRVVEGPVPELDGDLRLSPVGAGAGEALARLAELPPDRPAFVLLHPDGSLLAEGEATPALDTALVDRLRLASVRFTASAEEAERAVRSGSASAALLVRAPTIGQVEAVALAGERMPEKSTYFFPKLASGLLFSPFDE